MPLRRLPQDGDWADNAKKGRQELAGLVFSAQSQGGDMPTNEVPVIDRAVLMRNALEQAREFVENELDCRRRSYLPDESEYISEAVETLAAIDEALI